MGAMRNLAIVNTETGDRADVVQFRRPYAYPSRSFTTVGDEITPLLRFPLKALELKIFMLLLCTHAAGEFRVVVATDVAEQLAVPRPDVSTSLAYLVLIDALLKGAKQGRSHTYLVNPLLAFRGPGDKHQAVYNQYARPLPDPADVPRTPRKRGAKSGGSGAQS